MSLTNVVSLRAKVNAVTYHIGTRLSSSRRGISADLGYGASRMLAGRPSHVIAMGDLAHIYMLSLLLVLPFPPAVPTQYPSGPSWAERATLSVVHVRRDNTLR